MARSKTDFTNIKCLICGKGDLTSKTANREYNKKGKWTGKWTCKKCYGKHKTKNLDNIEYFKSKRPIDGKRPIWVIVNKDGKIINRNPNKDDLEKLEEEPRQAQDTRIWKIQYNSTNTCDKIIAVGFSWRRCGKNLLSDKPRRERDKEGNPTGNWFCRNCWTKYDANSYYNIIKLMRDCRTDNQDPNHSNALGDDILELACILYEWEDLNKKHDNYTTGTPIDCYDPKTGLYHQVQGRRFSNLVSAHGGWPFGNFGRDIHKNYETMVCFGLNEDGDVVERIYKFLYIELIEHVTGINIVKKSSRKILGWYEDCRINNEDELKKANEILKEILERRNKMQNTIKTTKCTDKGLLLEGDK